MATVYQEDYDSFYESIHRLVKYGNVSWGAAMCPRRMTPEEKAEYEIKRSIELMSQPRDEAISLSGKEYGDFIDRNYKAAFINLKKLGDINGLNTLERKIVDEIKSQNAREKEIDAIINSIFNNRDSSSINQSSNNFWEEFCNNSKDYWFCKPRKKSLWDKIKDFFE